MVRGRGDMVEVVRLGTPHTIGVREAPQPGTIWPTIKLLWSLSCRLIPSEGRSGILTVNTYNEIFSSSSNKIFS